MRASAEAEAARYVVGTELDVHYDPQDPTKSALEIDNHDARRPRLARRWVCLAGGSNLYGRSLNEFLWPYRPMTTTMNASKTDDAAGLKE